MPDTKKWYLQRKKNQNNRALEAKPKEIPVPKSRNIVCMYILHAREGKGGSISCKREEKSGREQGSGGSKKKSQSSDSRGLAGKGSN